MVATPRTWPVNWSAKLSRTLTLKDGTKLVTLDVARREVLAYLVTEVENFELTRSMQLLLAAAETGRSADRKAATDQVAIVLQAAQGSY
jgi:hypothetical protein